MKTEAPLSYLLTDYTKPDFSISKTDLEFQLNPNKTIVNSRLEIKRETSKSSADLIFDGCGLKIIDLKINGNSLDESDYCYENEILTIKTDAQIIVFESEVEINPAANTRLEGLYVSSGNFCTQCEAQGFRHITFYFDRPDVLSIFTTTIKANQNDYPIMLSNGGKIEAKIEGPTHTYVWQDPHPKPAYLFALVAGNLACVKGEFITRSKTKVDLEFYTEEHNKKYCAHAILSLQKAMQWDEDTFDLEYDLDLYMVVAVDDFNMGAMENKGLNVFNTKYVLASQQTATDQDHLNIESVIGHEYFHNWTGNRVTCRDWFQLSLKEGLTVYRDQEFSADLNSRGIQRINDVCVLRTHQFAEDASPMAHPVRPAQYQEINNFYTATVYNKGAEVVRMYECLLSKPTFKKAIDLYFERFDGQAVTTDDFRQVMQDASGVNLDQFQLWYEQSGTPVVEMRREYDAQTKELIIQLIQHPGETKGQQNKAFHIPVRFALLNIKGELVEIEKGITEKVLNLTEIHQSFQFLNVDVDTVPSIFRSFSAPIKFISDLSLSEKIHLLQKDTDDFNRWDAAQQIASDIILELMQSGKSHAVPDYIEAIKQILTNNDIDPAMGAELIQLPAEKYIAELVDVIDPMAIHSARKELKNQLAKQLSSEFVGCYQNTKNDTNEYLLDPISIGKRALNNACLDYLMLNESNENLDIAYQHYFNASNMTDRVAALSALKNSNSDLAQSMFNDFYQRFEKENLVIDKWFALQAVSIKTQGLEVIKELLNHPAFTLKNPNRVRSLISTFAHSGSVVFHQKDGSAYQLIADQLRILDALNPQVGARLAGAFIHWKKMAEPYSSKLKQCIQDLLDEKTLSKDVTEILQSSMSNEG